VGNSSELVEVGVFGTGNIGSDLIVKLVRSERVSLRFVVGRSNSSRGVQLARDLGIPTFTNGLYDLEKAMSDFPVSWLADTSNAQTHLHVRRIVEAVAPKVRIIDFTPSTLSERFAPGTGQKIPNSNDLSLISCGGQSSLPVISLIQSEYEIQRIELVSSLASKSVGPGTRSNLDEYIETTESAIRHFSKASQAKVILIINPADPPINMRVSLYLRFVEEVRTADLMELLESAKSELSEWVPNIEFLGSPVKIGADVLISYEVTGKGDFLPSYAGNLDVLTNTALKILERSK
jgi:acetaldehyde dehydrogenase